MTHLTYTPDGSAVTFSFKYDPAMVNALKTQIPTTDRKWNPVEKVWLISPAYIETACKLALAYLGELVSPPAPRQNQQEVVSEIITLRYLGTAKDRGMAFRIAMGHDGKDWRFVFPEPVLETWFGLNAKNPAADMKTLYAVLGIGRAVSGSEIKKAYRSAARQWHPDVCHEPNATEVFKRINEAYQLLSDPAKRARYDAGLALEASLERTPIDSKIFSSITDSWRPPLRCGYLLVKGRPQVGRLLIEEILQWTDIVDGAGRALVTSWQFGNDMYTEQWV